MIICLDKRQQDGPLGSDIEECDGLTITEIVKGGRIDRDGRFSIGDRIVEVNDMTLLDVNFETAQSLISEALKADKLKLNIVKDKKLKKDLQQLNDQQITKLNQFDPTNERSLDNHNHIKNDNKFNNQQNDNNQNIINNINNLSQDSNNSFNEATPDDYTIDTFKRNGTLNASNTKKMGKKYHIRLIKDINGLGFSITTRDNQIGQCPIYIKTILPVGAAKKDGNLKGGDRLIEVNGIEMTGKSHEEALKVLRDIETGQQVDLIVSRQENDKKEKQIDFERTPDQSSFNRTLSINKKDKQIELNNENNSSATKFKLPRQLPNDNLIPNHLDLNSKTREVLSFNIPLNDTSSAGLGFSVKGKMSASSSSKKTTDLGIFVKKIFHGGAAFKDGRLKENDQLISINGISLLNSSNAEAMETLKRSLYNDGLHLSNSINLVVARVSNPHENPNSSLLSNNYSKDETLYDTLGNVGNLCVPINNNRLIDNFHQRNLSTISTDSMKLNFYEQNYQTEESDDYNFRDHNHENNQFIETTNEHKELLNLNRKSNLFNGILGNDGLSTDSNDFTISTPVKTSMKSDFTGDNNHQLNDLSFNKFNNSNRQDVLIENDQENNDPNINREYFNGQNEQLDSSLNKSKDSQMMNLSNVTNQLSLNDDEEFNFNFQRDGFGRQSMSEKRYAQLDSAKNTDTFKRAKQRKLQNNENNQINNKSCRLKEKSNLQSNNNNNTLVKNIDNNSDFNNLITATNERQSKRSLSKFQASCCCFNDQQTYSTSSTRSSCPYHSQQTSPKTEQTSTSTQNDYLFNLSNMNNLKSTTLPNNQTTATLNYDNQFSQTNKFNLQPTPFTLAAQQSNQLNKPPTFLNRQSVNYQTPINYYSNDVMCNGAKLAPQFGQWLGMKKSSSLESLQTMMHEVKKETINYNTNLPYNTLRRPNKVQRNRNTNESFRTAIDKTYEEYMDNLTMETVNEEFSESGRFSITPSLLLQNNSTNQPALTKSLTTNENLNNQQTTNYQSKPSTTSLGTQLSNGANEISDEEIGLIRRKSTNSKKKSDKKSGILRTLFRFGSKKFKDKQTGQNTNKLSNSSSQQQQQQSVKKELEEEVEKIRARKAALYEQELIQEYCNRLKDQQKFQQIINQQMQQRQQLNPQPVNGNQFNQFNNTLQKQSLQQQQQQFKKQQNLRNLYVMDNNDALNFNQQQLFTNHLPQSNMHSNQIINKQQFNNYDTTPNYLQIEYGLQNRSNGIETNKIDNHLTKSTYPIGYDNNILNNHQNGFYNGYYNERKSFTNHLPNKQFQKNLKDNSIQQFETVHRPHNSYDLKEAMQRPGSRVGVKIDEDLNQYVIHVRKNQNELNRPYV